MKELYILLWFHLNRVEPEPLGQEVVNLLSLGYLERKEGVGLRITEAGIRKLEEVERLMARFNDAKTNEEILEIKANAERVEITYKGTRGEFRHKRGVMSNDMNAIAFCPTGLEPIAKRVLSAISENLLEMKP